MRNKFTFNIIIYIHYFEEAGKLQTTTGWIKPIAVDDMCFKFETISIRIEGNKRKQHLKQNHKINYSLGGTEKIPQPILASIILGNVLD